VVCKSCNETWLSALESAVKPVLVPLIAGRSGEVTFEMRRILSTWAAKTVITAEHIDSSNAVIHQTDRSWLKDNRSPPPGWHVWIATYGGRNWRDLGLFQHLGKLEIPAVSNQAPAQHNLELTLMGLGHVILLVINSSWQRIWDILDGLSTPGLVRIWPTSSAPVRWPTPHVLSDPEAEYFTTFLARVLEQPI
jgi:hypothetical protein